MCCVGSQNCQHATLKASLHVGGQIRGVACLDNTVGKMYAICENSNTVSVFHAIPPYEQLRGIHVSGLSGPTDIVACTTNNLLYVSDLISGCVWQVTAGGKVDHRLPTWSPTRRKTSAVCPVSLSVRFGRLTVVETSRISIYDSHDDKVDEIVFPVSATLHHGTETGHHSYMVALSDKSHSTIQEVGRDGIPVREWNLRSFSASVQPLYMAWDVSGFLCVVVRGSHKVLVLSDELREVRSVRLKKRSMPRRLSFLAQGSKPLLVVGAGNTMNIYDSTH